jgi:hypothetical protein
MDQQQSDWVDFRKTLEKTTSGKGATTWNDVFLLVSGVKAAILLDNPALSMDEQRLLANAIEHRFALKEVKLVDVGGVLLLVDVEKYSCLCADNVVTFVDVDSFAFVERKDINDRIASLLLRDSAEKLVDLSSLTTSVYGPTLIGCLLEYPHVYAREMRACNDGGPTLLDDEATVDVFHVVLYSSAFSKVKSEGVRWLEKHCHEVRKKEIVFSDDHTHLKSHVAWNWSLPSVLTDDAHVDALLERTLAYFARVRWRSAPITKLELTVHRRITGCFRL